MLSSRFIFFGALGIWAALIDSTAAHAQKNADIAGQMVEFGGLSKKDARAAIGTVSERIKRAADAFIGMNHPIRRSMRESLFGARAIPPDQEAVNDAKARLYLYGGLTSQTLSALFKTGPYAIANCTSVYAISEKWCEALMAAAARKSVAEIRRANTVKQFTMPGQATPMTTASTSSMPVANPTPIARPAVAAPVVPAAPIATQSSAITTTAFAPPSKASPAAMPAPYNRQAAGMSTAEQYKAARARYLASFKQRKANADAPKAPEVASSRPSSASSPAKSPQPPAASVKPQPTASVTNKPAAIDDDNDNSLEDDDDLKAAAPAKEEKTAEQNSEKPNAGLDSLVSDLLSDPLSSGKPSKSKSK